VERLFRDARINTIFEGSSEIMRLFIAREALDPHLKLAAAAVNTTLPWHARARAALKAGLFYTRWYPRLWLPGGADPAADSLHPALRTEVLEIRRQSRRLARALFHAMIAKGPALERCQMLLGRLVDIGAELFVWSATLARAENLVTDASLNSEEVERLLRKVRYFGKLTRQRLHRHHAELRAGLEKDAVALSRELLSA